MAAPLVLTAINLQVFWQARTASSHGVIQSISQVTSASAAAPTQAEAPTSPEDHPAQPEKITDDDVRF
jgi:hypothetical protein